MKLADGPVPLETDCSGGRAPVHESRPEGAYRRWRHYRADGSDIVPVHRLAAVAWCFDPDEHESPLDAIRGKEVHHRIPVRWLNTERNLSTVGPDDHAAETFATATATRALAEAAADE